jgi:transcription antitermination factor NusG
MQMVASDIHHNWFAVQVWAGREHRCECRLRERGYHVFLPTYREHRRWSDRIKVLDKALFAGYVFCRSSPDVVAKLITAPGIIRLVGDGTRPLPVAAHEVEALQRIVETGLQAEPWEYLDVGQRVHLEAGPLRGTEGIVLKVNQRRRLIVSVSLLRRSVAVEVDPVWVSLSAAALVRRFTPIPTGSSAAGPNEHPAD